MALRAVLILSLFSAASLAWADGASLVLSGLMDIGQMSGSANTASGTATGYGFAMEIALDLTNRSVLVIGADDVTRGFVSDTGSGTATNHFTALEVPILYRYRLSSNFFAGLGPYLALATGSVTQKNTATGTESSTSLSAEGFKTLDYGLTGSLGILIPGVGGNGFVVEGRYCYGIANLSNTSGESATLRDIQALLGFRFAL